jgi:lysozyme family protein
VSNFERAFEIIVGEEGGYSTDRKDTGNWTGGAIGVGEFKGTKFGISAAAYPSLDIINLTLDQARAIYLRDYWNAIKADQMPWPWALLVFDSAVNQGVGTAILLMQDALGVMTDGRIGPRTLAALQTRDDRAIARFQARRVMRYMRSRTFSTHGFGWITRSFVLARLAH